MDERRAALLVAGVALIVIGVATTTLARGAVLGLASVAVGLLLAASAAARLRAAAREQPDRSQTARAHPHAVPRVSFWRWSTSTAWGTTPWGIGGRVMLFAVVAGAMALVPDLSAEVPPWSGIAAVILFNVLFFVPPWVVERLTKPRRILPRSVDLSIVLPAAGILLAAAAALALGVDRWWMLVAALVLLVGGIAAGSSLTRDADGRSGSHA